MPACAQLPAAALPQTTNPPHGMLAAPRTPPPPRWGIEVLGAWGACSPSQSAGVLVLVEVHCALCY